VEFYAFIWEVHAWIQGVPSPDNPDNLDGFIIFYGKRNVFYITDMSWVGLYFLEVELGNGKSMCGYRVSRLPPENIT